jgi:monovalent cation/proton antiporter MnhG/PhaG subunit
MHAAVVILVVAAVFFSTVGAIGVWRMRDPWQRLHFITLPCSVSAWLIAAAVLIADKQKQAGLKVVLVAVVLFAANAVATQATARAVWVRREGQWPPRQPPRPPPSGGES